MKAVVKFRNHPDQVSWPVSGSPARALTAAVQAAEAQAGADHAGAWLYPGQDNDHGTEH